MTYIHPDSHLDANGEAGTTRLCPKCHRLARFWTVCRVCLNEMAAEYEKDEWEWEVDPNDYGKFERSDIIELHNRGISPFRIGLTLGISDVTARWIVACYEKSEGRPHTLKLKSKLNPGKKKRKAKLKQ